MDSKVKKKEFIELKTDIKLLLECLEFQKDDVVALKQALMTIASILQGSAEAKDVFRDTGGLQQVLTLVTSHCSSEVVETGLYCLGSAVERNGFGQNLVRQSSCLHDILTLIRTTMPQNLEDLDTDWIEGMEGRSLTLWSTLLSTACACVNNPMNEANQRICASLLPYLFSVLKGQSDERILRPVLSLIGLAVSGNGNNQDRVRKCGGLEIFVKKLDSLKDNADSDSSAKKVTLQLLSTVDACLSDNECNSKRFGELGGIKLVLSLMSDCCLDLNEKIHAVLTLAHALDAHIGNQKYICDCGGVTLLIQQLTETQDEEFSKTIKYLLHMCVSTDQSTITDDEEDLTNAENLISKMEAMKRHNDVEMLKKINELDHKLKSMENRQQVPGNSQFDISSDYRFRLDRLESQRVNINSDQNLGKPEIQKTGYQAEHFLQKECPTPREKSLMEQLIKEKSEKEQLEKLNHMLQENICQTHAALTYTRQDKSNQLIRTPVNSVSDQEVPYDKLTELQLGNNGSFAWNQPQISDNISAKKERNETGKKFQNLNSVDKDMSSKYPVMLMKINSQSQETPAMITRSGQRYLKPCDSNHPVDLQGSGPSGDKYEKQEEISPSVNYPVNSGNARLYQHTSLESENFPFVAVPLDLSNKSNLSTTSLEMQQNTTSFILENNGSSSSEGKFKATSETKVKNTMNKNAEIQCGTPFVPHLESGSRKDGNAEERISCINDRSSQTTPYCHFKNTDQKTGSIKGKRILIGRSKGSDTEIDQMKAVSSQFCNSNSKSVVIPRDCEKKDAKSVADSNSKIEGQQGTSALSKISSISNDIFVKPVALPPKRKIRITPFLGSDKISSGKSESRDVNNNSKVDECDSDIQSEFDLNLFMNVKKQACVKPTAVIKSQNNVRQIDKMLGKPESNVAEKWQVHPSTPHRQSIVPPRPAYSDCGTRRCLLGSPYSNKSHGQRRHSLDDSGIHSPRDILSMSRQASPVDSNIDGFRSSSDLSDEEGGPPNISAAVLRSSKKLNKKLENNCPGCTGVYKSGGEGLELNSRTYNIALETDPNTCPTHRKLRQLERIFIHKLRKSKSLKSRLKRKFQNKPPGTAKDLKMKEAAYDFSSESADSLSPPSNEDCDDFQPLRRQKKRRKRVPYSSEEEENLVEGVRTIGKHWNQILNTYNFHPSRTNVDLMDKYKRMMASNGQATSSKCVSVKSRSRKAFSMCEERRLRRGVMKHGYNWKTILNNFTFAQGRTTDDLRNKWRTLHKKI